MSYAAAIDGLYALAGELHSKPGQPQRKFELSEMRVLVEALGHPERKYPAILIAGTNGKGSTSATLASILADAGYRVGMYTSPHLSRVNERIQVNGVPIADDDFAALYFRIDDCARKLVDEGALKGYPSFFEAMTALAFLAFAEASVDIAVLEVGMGGRLDATNIVEPVISVITDISLDHTEWLGETIALIAREKAGILRRDGTMVTLPQHPEANQVLGEVATELDVRGVSAVPYMPSVDADAAYTVNALGAEVVVDSPLSGAHQHRNLALAIASAVELAEKHGFPVTSAAIAEGIKQTRWPGRMERIHGPHVEWVLDVAHNPAGVWALRAGLRSVLRDAKGPALIFSCLRDKPLMEMAQILFPLFEQVILAPIHAARAAAMDDLLAAARKVGTPAIAAESVSEALRMAKERAAGGVAVISGSVYLVGEARGLLMRSEK